MKPAELTPEILVRYLGPAGFATLGVALIGLTAIAVLAPLSIVQRQHRPFEISATAAAARLSDFVAAPVVAAKFTEETPKVFAIGPAEKIKAAHAAGRKFVKIGIDNELGWPANVSIWSAGYEATINIADHIDIVIPFSDRAVITNSAQVFGGGIAPKVAVFTVNGKKLPIITVGGRVEFAIKGER